MFSVVHKIEKAPAMKFELCSEVRVKDVDWSQSGQKLFSYALKSDLLPFLPRIYVIHTAMLETRLYVNHKVVSQNLRETLPWVKEYVHEKIASSFLHHVLRCGVA